MRVADLLGESLAALRGSPMRTALTALGITVGTLALVLIMSLSRGLETLIDDLVATESQLRQVVVMPGFGSSRDRDEIPEVVGEMSEEKRARLRRSLTKRGRRGPSFQLRTVLIGDETRDELAALPGVTAARPFLQDRFEVSLTASEDKPRVALSLGMPAEHPYYPNRILAGRWFNADDERAVVMHEVLLYQLGYTSDEAQAALVGETLRLVARKGGGRNVLAMMMSAGTSTRSAGGEILYTEELPIVGVLKERYGNEPSSVVEEGWSMQTDFFVPLGLAEDLWRRNDKNEGVPALLLEAETIDHVEAIEDAGRERGLRVQSVRGVVERIKQSLGGATLIASLLAGIAVFVAALGIVNTMVMSVMERTREIGLLKALGARSQDVVALFLMEGGILGLGGGLLGLGLARALGALGNDIGRTRIEEMFQMPFTGDLFKFPTWLLVGGVVFAVVTSLVASVVPSLRAARIDPVRALRHE